MLQLLLLPLLLPVSMEVLRWWTIYNIANSVSHSSEYPVSASIALLIKNHRELQQLKSLSPLFHQIEVLKCVAVMKHSLILIYFLLLSFVKVPKLGHFHLILRIISVFFPLESVPNLIVKGDYSWTKSIKQGSIKSLKCFPFFCVPVWRCYIKMPSCVAKISNLFAYFLPLFLMLHFIS